jgi:hypothetical protein
MKLHVCDTKLHASVRNDMDVNEHERLSNITSLTVELRLLKLEGTVKMYWCYQKLK